jgi:predicted AlkP superfamily pyrophosphatase or phosphodiesterase
MIRASLTWSFTLLLALLFTLAIGAAARADAPAKDHILVLISVDGLAWYYLDDPKAELPNLRKLAAEGARAKRMKVSLPSVTWPNHTTLVTGVVPAKHGVIGNSYWDRATNKSVPLIPDPLFDKMEIVKVPTVYDVAHDAGLKTVGICWPASRNAPTLDWTVPDCFPQELWKKYGTPALLSEARAAGVPVDMQEVWCKTNKGYERDQMYTDLLNLTIKSHKPNLGLLHLVEVDHAEHATGPRSEKAYEAVAFEDKRIGEIRATLEAIFPGKATLIITADHGFIAYRQNIQPNVAFRKANLLKVEAGKVTDRTVFAVGQGGASFIYILDKSRRDELAKQVASMFKGAEGIDEVIEPADLAKHGLATPDHDPHAADIVLTAKPGYSFGDAFAGDKVVTDLSPDTKGAHGHSPTQPDMYASFVAWGAGVKSGVVIEEMNNLDVASTAAAILGVPMKNVDGRVLKEILK